MQTWIQANVGTTNLRHTKYYTNLTSSLFGYQLGDSVMARVRQSSRSFSDSEWLYNQSSTDILKQRPQQANSPSIFANLTHLVVSWELLTTTIQTGNDNLYYRLDTRQGYTSTFYERTTPGLYDLDNWVQTLPNSDFQYGGLYDFRVTAINKCGSGSSSPEPFFVIPSVSPQFMNAKHIFHTLRRHCKCSLSWLMPT